jgi:hypothetical protein
MPRPLPGETYTFTLERDRENNCENILLVLKPVGLAIFLSIELFQLRCIYLRVGDVRSRYIGWSGFLSR